MILLWGLRNEGPMAAVLQALVRQGENVVMVDQRGYPTVSASLTVEPGGTSGWISVTGSPVPIEAFSGYYLRPYPVPDRYTRDLGWERVVEVNEWMLTLAEAGPPQLAVVNRPGAMASNDSKPAQLAQVRRLGFDVPDTVVTNDPDVAEEFWARHGTVVYKSTSGVRSIANTLTPAHRDRLSNLSTCPTQFQQYVDGDDYRVHVVGQRLFVTHIVSTATDYRYAPTQGGQRSMEPADLPDDVAERCLRTADELDLLVAGIDLRRTPDGAWYCFEVNTAPAFSWFEDHTGQPIADAVARLLSRGAD